MDLQRAKLEQAEQQRLIKLNVERAADKAMELFRDYNKPYPIAVSDAAAQFNVPLMTLYKELSKRRAAVRASKIINFKNYN